MCIRDSLSSDVIYGKTKVTSADWIDNKIIEFTLDVSGDKTLDLAGTFRETMSGLKFEKSRIHSNDKTIVFGWLAGDAPDVDKDTTYHLDITPKRGSTAITDGINPNVATLTFTVAVKPVIDGTNNKPKDIVWGQSWSFTPSLSNGIVNSADWELIVSGDYLSQDILRSDDISFDKTTGKLYGTWMPAYSSQDITSTDWASPDVASVAKLGKIEKKIKLKITRGSGDRAVSDDQEFTLVFQPVEPVIKSSDKAVTDALAALKSGTGFMWSQDVQSNDNDVVSIIAIGPGVISWDVNGYVVGPKTSADVSRDNVVSDDSLGLVYSSKQDGYTSTLKIYGKPTTTALNMAFPIIARNAKGPSDPLNAVLSIGSNSFDVTVASTGSADLPSNDVKVGDNIGTVILVAQPGPIESWETENLPDGLKLTDLGDGKTATLTGTFTTPRTLEDGITYTITATNKNINKSYTLSADIKVWGKPVVHSGIIDSSITTKKEYKWKLTGDNFPYYASWDVEISGLDETSDGSNVWKVDGGKSCISLDLVSKDGTATAKLIGSIDRVPSGGAFTVKVTAENYAGESDTVEFPVVVKGVAPSMTEQSFVLDKTTSGDASVKAGDAPLKMTATITDSKTLAAFGVSDAITLTKTPDTYLSLIHI